MSASDVFKGAAGATVVAIAVASGVVFHRHHHGGQDAEVRAGESGVVGPGGLEIQAERERAVAERTALAGENEKLRTRAQALETEVATVKDEKRRLEEKVADLTREVAAAKAPPPPAPAPPKPAAAVEPAAPASEPEKRLAVTFGRWDRIPELAGADWKEMGEAVRSMTGLIGDIALREKRGEDVPTEVGIQIAKENAKLAKFAFAVNGKLPTHVTGNGEFTHPIAVANLMAEHLAQAGRPLAEAQLHEIATIGEEYGFLWDELQATYTPDTLRLEKIMDELDLKRRTIDRMQAVLTADQREVVILPATHHVVMVDLYSPMLILPAVARPVSRPTAEALKAEHIRILVEEWKLDPAARDALGPAAERWFAAVSPRLTPVDKDDVQYYHVDDALPAGRAAIALRKELLQVPELSPEGRKRLIEDGRFVVPRLAKAAD
jgi:hypothetical protein